MSKDQGKYYTQDVPVPETPRPGKEPGPWGRTNALGKRTPRVDGYERVSGSAVYPSDMVLPNMLYGAILRCPHPHARLQSLDVSAAREVEGVRAVLTPDSPEADLQWPYGGMKTSLLVRHARYEGEPVAAVAAETPHAAADALRAMRAEWEVLDFVVDERRALESGAAQVHPDGNTAGESDYSRGHVERGFQEAAAVVELDFHSACEIHTPLEPHGCVARWEGDALTVWESTQGVYAVQSRLAEVLDMPLSKVRVSGHYMGGGFGSKLRAGRYTVLAALLARTTGKPVKLFLSREETFLTTGNRPPSTMRVKAGADREGRLTAIEFTGIGASGAYPAGGTALLEWLAKDLYSCTNVRTKATDVYINAGPARPFRAPGHPQASWALEQAMDALAEKLGMDPVALRLRNIPTTSQGREGSPPYTTTGLEECIRKGAREFGWDEARKRLPESGQDSHRKRGVGMGACVWFAGDGGPPSTVVVKLFGDGSVNLNMGASDIGTGTKTIMALVVAEELGVDPDLVQIEHADTGTTQYATPSGGSKTVPTEAPAVRNACVEVKRRLLDMAAEQLNKDPQTLRFRGQAIEAEDGTRVAVAELDKLGSRGVVVGVGYRGPNPENKVTCPFGAQFCEVEVDTRTGEVRLLRFLAAQESGRVMDRLTFDSQTFGGIVMGIGLGMTEERILDNRTGKLCNRNWHDYKLPTAMDVADRDVSVAIDMPDYEANISGAKGLGEPVTIPTAAAIANAIYHATGVRPADTPCNPLRLRALLAGQDKEA
jgi:xanthine dehydrogenase YagR molybdenum-binding subunit